MIQARVKPRDPGAVYRDTLRAVCTRCGGEHDGVDHPSQARLFLLVLGRWLIYCDFRDWWVGWFRDTGSHYFIVVPTVVIRRYRIDHPKIRPI
jgi:hypothetical protein